MSVVELAALLTSVAALLAAGTQWGWLVGPRRNGHRARLPEIEARLAATEAALDECDRYRALLQRRERRRQQERRLADKARAATSENG